jgi:glycosyltransferase involved in cell wall biosynthesis
MASEFLAILDYRAVRKARKIITLTDQLKWEIEKLYDREAVVARGCLSTEALSYQPKEDVRKRLGLQNKRIIFSVGRLDPRKRIDVLIKAFARILPKYEDLYLLIGGTGEDEERLKKLTEELGITERVKFLGFIPDAELFDYYAACDVFAFPSWTTSGITPYEALAVGKKVVWTSEADEPILGDKHVFLADPTVEDFARGLEEALNIHIDEKVNLTNYTWNKYFETVYGAVIEAING